MGTHLRSTLFEGTPIWTPGAPKGPKLTRSVVTLIIETRFLQAFSGGRAADGFFTLESWAKVSHRHRDLTS